MSKNLDYKKEEYRGAIKQIMKMRGLRSISLANYYRWKEGTEANVHNVHSLKIGIMDGYLDLYKYKPIIGSTKCGEVLEDAPFNTYEQVYNDVMEILSNEKHIPYKVKRNILVGLSR